MITYYHHQFQKRVREVAEPGEQFEAFVRAFPGQQRDSRLAGFGSGMDLARYVAQYALSPWVYTGVTRMAEVAAAVALQIVDRRDSTQIVDDHPLLDLLGPFGMPDESTDSYEFWENHFIYLELAGNSYWYWGSQVGGAPDEVYLLPPWQVRIVPGSGRTVANYEFWYYGERFTLGVDQVTHFRKPNPFNRYYGLPALEALMLTVMTDREMAEWNRDFFGDGVAIPAGIFVVPPHLSDAERERLDSELNAVHADRRKTAVVRADPGATVWHSGGLGPHEMDFEKGRKLNRQIVYEALDLPLGFLSETSTEAHARVAERRFINAVHRRLLRCGRKLTADALPFWPQYWLREARFEDVRRDVADWDQQAKKLGALKAFMTINEIRTSFLGLKADERYEQRSELLESPEPVDAAGGGSDRPVLHTGQVRDVLDAGE